MGIKRQLSSRGDLSVVGSQQKLISSSTSMSVLNTKPGHKSSQLNHMSTINQTTSNSLSLSKGGNQLSRLKGKFKKQEEGFEGLPDDFQPVADSDFEEADSCFSCNKQLSKKFGALTKKGRHHCRRCGRTVCDRCRKNDKRLSKNDKKDYPVCDQCDFEISNYHLFGILESVKNLQTEMHQTLQKKNQTIESEIKAYQEQKKELKQELESKQDEYEQTQSKLKSQLQKVNLEFERYQKQIEILSENQKAEQEKRGTLLSERNQLNLKEAELKFKLKNLEQSENSLQSQQNQLLKLISTNFSEEVQELIKAKFEKIRNLRDSELLEDSDLIFLQDSMVGGNGEMYND